jgi:hypothetical protein
MSKKKLAKTNNEFDRRFDDGEDIHDLIDMSKARISHPGKKSALPSMLQKNWSTKSTALGLLLEWTGGP